MLVQNLKIYNCFLPSPLKLTGSNNIVTYKGFAWLTRRGLDLMIEFIGPLYNWLQHFTNHYLTHCHLLRLDTPLTSNCTKLLVWVESYVTTDSQSASLPWNKAPIWGLRPDTYLSLTITALFLWVSSLTRGWVWLLYMLLALASVVFLGSESLWARNHILLSQICDFPFRRLLRLAGSRWRYSTPPPHRVLLYCLLVVSFGLRSVHAV
jgi:hypothetical protein